MIITDITAQAISNFPNTSLAAPGALGHTLQNPKWLTGSGEVSTPRFVGAPINFC